MSRQKQTPRIGIYGGTFNPVHAGHIGFALHAKQAAGLTEVYLLPERIPRHKTSVEHYGHRVAMLKQAVKPYEDLSVMEVVDKQLSVRRTMPQLKHMFADCQLVLLMGAEVFIMLPEWAGVRRIIETFQFVVSARSREELAAVLRIMQLLELPAHTVTVVDSVRPEVSGALVRDAIRADAPVTGLLPSVYRYARQEWLYAQLPH